jgi:hypothetical protein
MTNTTEKETTDQPLIMTPTVKITESGVGDIYKPRRAAFQLAVVGSDED